MLENKKQSSKQNVNFLQPGRRNHNPTIIKYNYNVRNVSIEYNYIARSKRRDIGTKTIVGFLKELMWVLILQPKERVLNL